MQAIITTLSEIKGKEVKNVDLSTGTFESEKSVFSFELTKTGKVKSNSVKFLWTVQDYSNCIY